MFQLGLDSDRLVVESIATSESLVSYVFFRLPLFYYSLNLETLFASPSESEK